MRFFPYFIFSKFPRQKQSGLRKRRKAAGMDKYACFLLFRLFSIKAKVGKKNMGDTSLHRHIQHEYIAVKLVRNVR